MAILPGPLMSVNDTGKVPNRKVAKTQIVHVLINNVGRTLLLGSPPKQNGRPVGYITLQRLYLRQNVDFGPNQSLPVVQKRWQSLLDR